MTYETHHAKKHIVVSVVPNFDMRTPIGFAVAAPKYLKYGSGVLHNGELDALLQQEIVTLQSNAYTFPDGLVHDVLHRDDLDSGFALALASRLNYNSIPGLVKFVYYASGNQDKSSSEVPKIVFDAGIVTTRGYEALGWRPDTTLLHRRGKPVLMLDSGQQLISEQSTLQDLQAIVLNEFGESLDQAGRPCFVHHNGDFHRVFLNPAHAYGHLQ